jgi:DNA-binding Lrp family transcriptional regulator
MKLSMDDRRLIEATQAGLPLVSEPYAQIAKTLGMSTEWVQDRLSQMQADGLIRRIGAVPNHFKLGFTANGMSVWDVADDQVDALGEQIGSLPGVSHCYRRPRYPGVWSYNLFAMLHGRSREEVESQAEQVRQMLGEACRAHEILYSSRILKKTGLRLTPSSNHSPRSVEES